MDTPEEVAKQYFTLLINLAQALLNMPPRDMHRELAAMDASGVSAFHDIRLDFYSEGLILGRVHAVTGASLIYIRA